MTIQHVYEDKLAYITNGADYYITTERCVMRLGRGRGGLDSLSPEANSLAANQCEDAHGWQTEKSLWLQS